MFIKYPTPQNYRVPQSQIRCRYNKALIIKQKAQNYLNSFKRLDRFHKIKSDVTIDILDYFKNIIKKWDDKSKQINGWTSCYLIITIITAILNGLKRKYGYSSKYIEFSNIDKIYQITNVNNMKIIPINNLLFGLLIATEEHCEVNFVELQQIVEIMAQSQVLYQIANYPSRGNRTYQLPWERIDDPVILYRKKFTKKRNNIIKTRKKLQPDPTQLKIQHFFKKQTLFQYDQDETSILSDGDDEILQIMEELDNTK